MSGKQEAGKVPQVREETIRIELTVTSVSTVQWCDLITNIVLHLNLWGQGTKEEISLEQLLWKYL